MSRRRPTIVSDAHIAAYAQDGAVCPRNVFDRD